MGVEIQRIDKQNRGLDGFSLVETPVVPYVKDFRANVYESSVEHWKGFDLTNWAFFLAFHEGRAVGAAAVASRTDGIHMLEGRDDLAELWDLRVREEHKRLGVGQALFDSAVAWCREAGLRQMKIECQNNNVPACRFYHKQGAALCAVDEHAYYDEPELQHEAQFIWMLDL